MPEFYSEVQEYDTSVGELADACAEYNASALYTSSAAYVVQDMAAIIVAVEGREEAKLNYWGLSYGTILGAEFIQTYPERVGRVVLDGVFDAEANAEAYTSQLPNDELFVRDAITDFARSCEEAGPDTCSLSTPSNHTNHSNSTSNIPTRLSTLQASLHRSPMPVTDATGTWSITAGIFSFFMYSFLKLPPTWPIVTTAVSALERGDPTLFASLLTGATTASVVNTSAPATGSLAGWPIQCTDNAPSNQTTLASVARLILDISLEQETPWLNADLSTLSFCRNFPNTRPRLPNLGASKLTSDETNSLLTALNTSVLIINPEHDPTTPVTSAERLHSWLPTSSQLITRKGPGHTSISLGSLGLVQKVRKYFLTGEIPMSREVHDVNQVVFGSGIETDTMTPNAVFDNTLSEKERVLLESTYVIFKAFMGLP